MHQARDDSSLEKPSLSSRRFMSWGLRNCIRLNNLGSIIFVLCWKLEIWSDEYFIRSKLESQMFIGVTRSRLHIAHALVYQLSCLFSSFLLF